MDIETDHEKELHPVAQKFVTLLESVVARSVSFVHDDEYVEAYKNIFKSAAFTPKCDNEPPPLVGSSKEAKKMRINFNDLVRRIVKNEIDNVLLEENINTHFVKLDEMKTEFQYLQEKISWRPPGNVKMHMRPFNAAAKIEAKNELLRMVNSEREKLNISKARILRKREKAEDLNSKIQKKLTNLRKDIVMNVTC